MPISLLRKPPPPRREPEVAPSLAALSLPDLTVPLIDPSAWANLPPEVAAAAQAQARAAAQAGGGHAQHGSYNQFAVTPRAGPGMPANRASMPAHAAAAAAAAYQVQYGGNENAWRASRSPGASQAPLPMPIPGATPPSPGAALRAGRVPSKVRDTNGGSPDFHRPFSPNNVVPLPTMPVSRARGKGRKAAALTVVVAGPSGSGKTSFIDALTGVLDPDATRMNGRMGPTASVLRHTVTAASERRTVVLLDTPGLPAAGNGPATRGRALNSLLGIVEDRLAKQLAEETKVIRRKADGGDLVHLVVYVIDARTVLCPTAPVEIDWDTIAEPPADKVAAHTPPTRPDSDLLEPNMPDVEARLPVDDIEAIRRFSARANVLPVLTHADALTSNELAAARAAVVRDLATVFGREPLGAWGVLSASVDTEAEDMLDDLSEPPSAADKTDVPYAVFAPEPGPGFTRAFRWGRADAADAAHSDLPAVRDAVVSAAEWLRTTTREVVYERFRTERLLSARGVRPGL